MKTLNNFRNTSVATKNFSSLSIDKLMDKAIKEWPYREAASSVDSYLIKKGIPATPRDELDILYIMELWLNLLHWAPAFDLKHNSEFSSVFASVVNLDIYIENIEYILEQCNYKARRIKKPHSSIDKYIITKRDAAVDAAVEAVPELRDVLLSYMDVRNKTSISFKKEALRELGNYFETIKDSFKGTPYSSIWDSVSFALNNFEIRHNNKNQVKLTNKEKQIMYDKTFRLALFLLQVTNVMDYKKDIDNYKKH